MEDVSLTWAEFYDSSYILQSAVSLVLLAVRVFLLLLVISAEEKPRCTHEEKMLQCKYIRVHWIQWQYICMVKGLEIVTLSKISNCV